MITRIIHGAVVVVMFAIPFGFVLFCGVLAFIR